MDEFLLSQYTKLQQKMHTMGLDKFYFLKLENMMIEIYDINNQFVYASNDVDEIIENIDFLEKKQLKQHKKHL